MENEHSGSKWAYSKRQENHWKLSRYLLKSRYGSATALSISFVQQGSKLYGRREVSRQ